MLEPQRTQSTGRPGEEQGRSDEARKGISWLSMLLWIALAFVLAGLVAYRLVTPFFHR